MTVLAAAAALTLLVALTANAWFTTSAKIPAQISTGNWGQYLSFGLGCSQAIHTSSSGCNKLVRVASFNKQGELSLDFGDVKSPSSSSWCDVFRVTSSAPMPLQVSFRASGAIAPFIRSVTFANDATGGRVDPKKTRSVAVVLVVPQKAISGTYTGTLTVAIIGGSESHVVPMTVRILGKPPCPSPSGSPSPSCSPSTSPSCSPSASPSCSPSTSPSCSPSSSPSCGPSTSPSCSPSASPSCSPSSSPSCSPSASPTAVRAFALTPGLSRILPGTDRQPKVAGLQADGTIRLDFGQVPRAQKVTFSDVVRMASQAGDTATVNLTVSGPAAAIVERVGYWEGKSGIATDGLTLRAGQTKQLAFALYAPSRADLGKRRGTLTITAKLGDGRIQQTQLPMVIDVVTAR